MEIRARYVLVGLFSLAVIIAGFGFVYWLNTVGGLGERASYRVRFESPVSGLLLGSAVQFNGIRVGEVTDLRLDPAAPSQVVVTISVTADTPVRSDTQVGLAFGGLTGVPEIALTGGSPDAPTVQVGEEPPLLIAGTSATLGWTDAARVAFARIDQMLSDNSEALKNTLANLDTFSEALAQNSERVDGIFAGLERLTGGEGGRSAAVFYGLTAPAAPVAEVPDTQLVVTLPSSLLALETTQLLIESDGGETRSIDDAQWSDALPRLVQSTVIRSFENAGYPRVGSEMQGMAADYTLMIDIRRFRVTTAPDRVAEIDLTAKIMDTAGQLAAARRFQATAPAAALGAADAARALDAAFADVVVELVPWTLATMAELGG